MLQAMNTGHDGSLSTCHANSPSDALRRVETLVLMGDVDLPLAAVREQVAPRSTSSCRWRGAPTASAGWSRWPRSSPESSDRSMPPRVRAAGPLEPTSWRSRPGVRCDPGSPRRLSIGMDAHGERDSTLVLTVPPRVAVVAGLLADGRLGRVAGRRGPRVGFRQPGVDVRWMPPTRRRGCSIAAARAAPIERSTWVCPAWLDASARAARSGASLRHGAASTALRSSTSHRSAPTSRRLSRSWIEVHPSPRARLTSRADHRRPARSIGRGLCAWPATVGGPSTAVLDAVASTLHERAALAREVRALSTQARASARSWSWRRSCSCRSR